MDNILCGVKLYNQIENNIQKKNIVNLSIANDVGKE